MSWFESGAIAMYPSQGRSDYYNRKARYVSEANVTVSASALTSKHGFVINGLVPKKADAGSQLSAGSLWIRGYVFTVASDISITEQGSSAGDVLCAVLRTDENGQRVGIADRIINQYDSTYELDAKDRSAFYGIRIVTKTQDEWNKLPPQHEECRYKSVSGTSGNYTEFYLRLAIWDGSAWEQPKNDNVALNGLKIDASVISVTMAETQSGAAAQEDYTATQDLATLLNKNFIIDDGVTGENGHIRVRELTTSNLSTVLSTVLVGRQPAIVRKSDVPYLFVGDGENALNAMHPITARTVEGWIEDANGLTADTTTHYKISGDINNNGLKIACGDSLYALFAGDTVTINGKLSVTNALTANGGIKVTSGDVTVEGGNVTGKIGNLPNLENNWSWASSPVASTDTIASGFAKVKKEVGNLRSRMATAESFTNTSLVANGQNLNVYYGTSYWGKRYYAPGANTVQNTPVPSTGFHLEVLRNGDSTTTQRITIYGSGRGGSAPTVYVRSLTGGSGTQWSEWQEIAEAKGSYHDMTVGNYTSTGTIKDKFDDIENAFDNMSTREIINKDFNSGIGFGGTGEPVTSINDLVDVLHGIFTGNYTVSGTIKSKNGFYAKGGV